MSFLLAGFMHDYACSLQTFGKVAGLVVLLLSCPLVGATGTGYGDYLAKMAKEKPEGERKKVQKSIRKQRTDG